MTGNSSRKNQKSDCAVNVPESRSQLARNRVASVSDPPAHTGDHRKAPHLAKGAHWLRVEESHASRARARERPTQSGRLAVASVNGVCASKARNSSPVPLSPTRAGRVGEQTSGLTCRSVTLPPASTRRVPRPSGCRAARAAPSARRRSADTAAGDRRPAAARSTCGPRAARWRRRACPGPSLWPDTTSMSCVIA